MRWKVLRMVLISLAIVTGVYAYLGWNGWRLQVLWFGTGHAGVYWTLFILLAASYPFARLAGQYLPPWFADALKIAGSYWLAVTFYGLLLAAAGDMLELLLRLFGAGADAAANTAGACSLAALAGLLIRGIVNANSPVVRRYRVRIPKTAGGMSRLKIAAASDLHLGSVLRSGPVKKLVGLLDQLQPDLILLVGDVSDDDMASFTRLRLSAELGRLKAPLGVYAVLGNHEYISGRVEDYVQEMAVAGIPVLRDETRFIAGAFHLIGRKDKAAERFAEGSRLPAEELVRRALQDGPGKPIIALDHQPSNLQELAEAGVDLSLSGHTHRGQLAPNHYITRRMFLLDWGHKMIDGMHAVVSSGFGTWGPPLRIGSRSEVVEIEVEFAG